MPRILLSSVCKPFGPRYGDGFGTSFEGTHQLMWAQGVFRPRGTTTQWGIDFIAHNLNAPVTTLHYPTLKQFKNELRQGYDFVGIAFNASTLHKLLPMAEAVRRIAPRTKLILGGYGTALDTSMLPKADYICRGEGVRFMRELLGEPLDTPLRQPVITQKTRIFSMPLGKTGYIFAGLGCPNGCDFCATSHYFNRKHIAFLPDGAAILQAIQELHAKEPDITTYWINDEDFLLNQKRGRGYLEAVRNSTLPPVSLSIFSSVKALSQYTATELVEMGVDWIWVGYEGKRAGYAKMAGRPYSELFPDLHRHGITVMASMIIGFDYQTAAIIQEEFDELMELRPSICQFLIYGPAFGTPLYDRMKKENRFQDDTMTTSSKQDGFSLGFTHPHIGAEEMVSIQRGLYRQEFERLGPSVFRAAEDWLEGYKNLKDHELPRVKAKALQHGHKAHRAALMLNASQRWVQPGPAELLKNLRSKILSATGSLTFTEHLSQHLIPLALHWTDFKIRFGLDSQPDFTRKVFR